MGQKIRTLRSGILKKLEVKFLNFLYFFIYYVHLAANPTSFIALIFSFKSLSLYSCHITTVK